MIDDDLRTDAVRARLAAMSTTLWHEEDSELDDSILDVVAELVRLVVHVVLLPAKIVLAIVSAGF